MRQKAHLRCANCAFVCQAQRLLNTHSNVYARHKAPTAPQSLESQKMGMQIFVKLIRTGDRKQPRQLGANSTDCLPHANLYNPHSISRENIHLLIVRQTNNLLPPHQ